MAASSAGLSRVIVRTFRVYAPQHCSLHRSLTRPWSSLEIAQRVSPASAGRLLASLHQRPYATETKSESVTSEDGVLLSERCVKRLREIISSKDEHLRVFVEGGGCSGFQYKFEIDDSLDEEDDMVIEQDGARVVIDKDSMEYLKGATIDYQEELIRSAFRVMKNPKAEHGCSCGSSFSLKI
ncbi:iron-sulfur cluster insertion protein ErpA-like [Ptychodera flava]|uniref:iron-sulfur cluster insertion protein ErpA-like n=1 Tax=Ptychodera flava TaxID=63121 RepID=UPI003969F677